jgi:hypothetical protein
VVRSWYQRWYRTERNSAHLSVPGVAQDEPTERLTASHNPKVGGSNPAPATSQGPLITRARVFAKGPHRPTFPGGAIPHGRGLSSLRDPSWDQARYQRGTNTRGSYCRGLRAAPALAVLGREPSADPAPALRTEMGPPIRVRGSSRQRQLTAAFHGKKDLD